MLFANSDKSDTSTGSSPVTTIASNASTASKVLIVTYYWPPSGGAGVQRWLKFSKYLPEFGWEPVILTVDPAFASYPVIDKSLNREISGNLKVFHTPATDWFRIYASDKTKVPSAGFASGTDKSWKSVISRFVRGNFFIPDPRRGWNRHAFKKACEIIEEENITAFVTTSPPHSTQLIGLRIKKKFKWLRWIADLRDPWTDIYYYKLFYPTFIPRMIDAYYERSVLRNADKIIAVGEQLKNLLSGKTTEADRISVIPNGYDDSDFSNEVKHGNEKFIITYTGTLSEKYPVRSLAESLGKINREYFSCTMRIAGKVPESITDLFVLTTPEGSVELIPYVPHDEAIRYMYDSSLLLLIIPESENNRLIITGKIFEYMATRIPVLCIGPKDGEAARILDEAGAGECFDYDDTQGMISFIRKIHDNPWNYRKDPSGYSRRNLTSILAGIMNSGTEIIQDGKSS